MKEQGQSDRQQKNKNRRQRTKSGHKPKSATEDQDKVESGAK